MRGETCILIRCDGGAELGMGHVVRCLSLAGAVRRMGGRVVFATWGGGRAAESAVREGFEAHPVGQPVGRSEPLGEVDLEETLAAARQAGAAAVLVDHYQADAAWLGGVAREGRHLAVIDDMADRDLSMADWVLNQNGAAGRVRYPIRPGGTTLLGPKYAMLRPQFAAGRCGLQRKFAKEDNRVLLTLGGGAMSDRCVAILRALEDMSTALSITCVSGQSKVTQGMLTEDLDDIARKSRHCVNVESDVSDMAKLMALSDVSVNGGGSTCWELCCLGVPQIAVSLSPDQADNVSDMDGRGIALGLGAWNDAESPAAIASALRELLGDPWRRSDMSVRGMARVDGLGVDRVASSLLRQLAMCRGAVR